MNEVRSLCEPGGLVVLDSNVYRQRLFRGHYLMHPMILQHSKISSVLVGGLDDSMEFQSATSFYYARNPVLLLQLKVNKEQGVFTKTYEGKRTVEEIFAHYVLCYTKPSITKVGACPVHGFHQCRDGTCILTKYRCDLVSHCSDGSDEETCPSVCVSALRSHDLTFCRYHCVHPQCVCDKLYFQCKVGGCINSALVCNGVLDCSDNSDETNCEKIPTSSYTIQNSKRNVCNWKNSNNTCFECKYDNKLIHLSDLCIYDTGVKYNILYCHQGEHLYFCKEHPCTGLFKCPGSYCLPTHKLCNGEYDCPKREDEDECQFERAVCPGMLKCSKGICVKMEYICDGIDQCEDSRDDEWVCSLPKCPLGCVCEGASVDCSDTGRKHLLPDNGLQFSRILIWRQNQLHLISTTLVEFIYLHSLDLSFNSLKYLSQDNMSFFARQSWLKTLLLQNNMIKHITSYSFFGLQSLEVLNLKDNPLSFIEENAFSGLYSLKMLNLSHLWIHALHSNSFALSGNIKVLDISHNQIVKLPPGLVKHLKVLQWLLMNDNLIASIHEDDIMSIPHLEVIEADDTKLCCIVMTVDRCIAPGHSLSSCTSLFADVTLQHCVWIVAILL